MQWRQKTTVEKTKTRARRRRAERQPRPAPQPVEEQRPAERPPAEPAPLPPRPQSNRPATRQKKQKKGKGDKPKLSRLQKPDGMSLEEWQRQLRRQFGREQKYTLKNLGEQPLFSEFEVTNPQSRRTYRVHIRGLQPGDNFCTCPDFTTNTLGTCKHIEFTLAKLERKRGARAELRAGWQPPYSEVFLHYGARREVRFRPGSTCSVKLARLASAYFGADGTLLPDAFLRFGDFLAEASKLDD